MKKFVLNVCIPTILCLAAINAQSIATVKANPIPVPALIMPEEIIDVTIFHIEGTHPSLLWAKVDGTYPFYNIGYQIVTMYYPVPPDATNISVQMNETALDWEYSDKTYPTTPYGWPMINWTITPVPDHLIIKTHYEHILPINLENGKHAFIYAMGTGKYLETYAKQTTAYLTIRMETNYTNLEVYTVLLMNDTETWTPTNYTITKINATEAVTLTVKSQQFHPLVEDFLMEFTNEPHSKWDINADGKTDMKDVAIVAKAFGSYPEHTKWNPMLDITGSKYLVPDSKIDMRDLALIAKHYGE